MDRSLSDATEDALGARTAKNGRRVLTRRRIGVASASAAAVIALALTSGCSATPEAELETAATTTAGTEQAPSGPPASPEPPAPVTSYFDDGIADDEYPPAAKSRGKGYPDALKMEKWVWDKVGPGWTLATYGEARSRWDDDASEIRPGYFYLISPEGVYFNVGAVPTQVRNEPRLYSWDETKQRVRMGGYDLDEGLVSLKKLDFDPMSFAGGGSRFVAGSAGGVELWEGDESRYRWSAEEGWSKILGEREGITWPHDGLGAGTNSSPDGSLAAFILCDGQYCSPKVAKKGQPEFIIYSLDEDRSWHLKPKYVPPATKCEHWISWHSTTELRLYCGSADGRIAIDIETGATRVLPALEDDEEEAIRFSEIRGAAAALGFELETDTNEFGSEVFTQVHVTASSGEVFRLEDLGRDGWTNMESIRVLTPGVYVVEAFGTVFHVDTVASEIYVVRQEIDSPKNWVTTRSFIGFGEASPSDAGHWDCDC